MRLFAALLFFIGSSGAVFAQSAARRTAHREEAWQLVRRIIDGGGVDQSAARIRFLGEQSYAAHQLAVAVSQGLETRERINVAMALGGIPARDSENVLIELARDEDAAVRMNAADGLWRLQSHNVEPLKPLLKDKVLAVRRSAARALGGAKNRHFGALLMSAAKVEAEPEVREALLVAVGQSADRSQVPALSKFLTSSSESARFAAAQGLCRLGAPAGFAFAKRLLASPEKSDRHQGLTVLEGSSAQASMQLLAPLLNDPDKSLAAGAARILYQGGDQRLLEWLVVASRRAKGDDKLAYETEIEKLDVTDEQRQSILVKAGAP